MASINQPNLLPGLNSPGPHPDMPEEARIFAPFIGSWTLIVTWHDGGQPARVERGEWHFAWVLEGRGVQDVWIVPPRSERGRGSDLYEYGTSIRFHDPAIGAWRSTWIGPMHGVVRTFTARQIGDEVVLETTPDEAERMRWAFSDIRPDGFAWRNFVWRGDGFELVQDFVATRA